MLCPFDTRKSGAKVKNDMSDALKSIQHTPTNHIGSPIVNRFDGKFILPSSFSKAISCGRFGGGLYKIKKAVSPKVHVTIVIRIGIRQPKFSPSIPKVRRGKIILTGYEVLKIPITVPISRPVNQRESVWRDIMTRVIAPIPAIILPKPARRNTLLVANVRPPIITRIKENTPILNAPKRSEREPAKIPNNIPGTEKRLMSRPASAWVNLWASMIKGRMGGTDCKVKPYVSKQIYVRIKITQRYLIDGIPHH